MLFRQPFFMRTAILPLSRTDESVGSRGMPADLSRSYFFRLLFRVRNSGCSFRIARLLRLLFEPEPLDGAWCVFAPSPTNM